MSISETGEAIPIPKFSGESFLKFVDQEMTQRFGVISEFCFKIYFHSFYIYETMSN